MLLFGKATVHGISGTVTTPAIAAISESIESEHTADVEEHIGGDGELRGFGVANERFNVDLTLIPDAASQDAANGSMAKITIPSKVTLAGFPSKSGSDTVAINGDYIYKGGMRKTIVKGQATFRLPIFRPLSSSLTVDQLVAAVT